MAAARSHRGHGLPRQLSGRRQQLRVPGPGRRPRWCRGPCLGQRHRQLPHPDRDPRSSGDAPRSQRPQRQVGDGRSHPQLESDRGCNRLPGRTELVAGRTLRRRGQYRRHHLRRPRRHGGRPGTLPGEREQCRDTRPELNGRDRAGPSDARSGRLQRCVRRRVRPGAGRNRTAGRPRAGPGSRGRPGARRGPAERRCHRRLAPSHQPGPYRAGAGLYRDGLELDGAGDDRGSLDPIGLDGARHASHRRGRGRLLPGPRGCAGGQREHGRDHRRGPAPGRPLGPRPAPGQGGGPGGRGRGQLEGAEQQPPAHLLGLPDRSQQQRLHARPLRYRRH